MRTGSIVAVLIVSGVCAAPVRAADGASGKSGPQRPVTSEEVQQLQQEISDSTRSNVEGIFDYHAETGDLNNRLDYFRYGARINYKWRPDTLLYLRGADTSYLTKGRVLDERGFNLTAGLKHNLSDEVSARFEAGATRFSTDASTVNALGSLDYGTAAGGLHVTASRTNVEESLLSAAGIRPRVGALAGRLVGQVMDNRVMAGGHYKLFERLDLFGEGGAGTRTGQNVESNSLRAASGGVGYNLVTDAEDSSLSLVRASYQLDYFGFDKDLLGYGGVSLLNRRGQPVALDRLGDDGISPAAAPGRPGVGGYFSPSRFIGNVGRLEAGGRPHKNVDYRISGFLGTQNYTGADTRVAGGIFGSLTVRLSDRFSVPVTYLFDNFGPFQQHTLLIRLVARL